MESRGHRDESLKKHEIFRIIGLNLDLSSGEKGVVVKEHWGGGWKLLWKKKLNPTGTVQWQGVYQPGRKQRAASAVLNFKAVTLKGKREAR